MNSIRRRLLVFFVVTITLVLSLSGGYSYWRSRAELADDLQQSADSLRSRLETSLPGPMWNFDDYQLDRILDSEMLSPKIQQIVIENGGKLISGRKQSHLGRIERLMNLPEKQANEIEFDVFYQDNFQRPIGKVRFLVSDDLMSEQLHKLVLEKIIEIALLDIIILLALSRSLTVFITKPLQVLQNMLERAAIQTDAGIADANVQLPDSPFSEFADVTSSYNRIARRLQEDLRKQKATEEAMRQAKNAAETAYLQLKEAQTSLVQSEKMASLGSLVAGVAHEINTPIGIILTSASVLVEESSTFQQGIESGAVKKSSMLRYTETAMQSASLIQSNAMRAATLIQSFKLVAVDQTSEARRNFDLRGYINEVILSLHPTIKHRPINIQVQCQEDIEIDGYPGALSQIITNLVTNAIHHAFAADQSGTLQISATEERGMIRIIFSDNGRGIPAEHLSKIFDPFFTTRRGEGGSGLGLNIVYNLVTQTLGGTIAISSSPGNGATFTIAFPRVSPEQVNSKN